MLMIEIYGTDMSTGEIRTHFINYSNDLPQGVTVSSATAVMASNPIGGTVTMAVGVISSNIVPVTMTTPTIAGQYAVTVTATLSDAEKSVARLMVNVSWGGIRPTMVDLIEDLRGMTNAGVNDYAIAGKRYWSDEQMQDTLDENRTFQNNLILDVVPVYSAGVTTYTKYYSGLKNWEASPILQGINGNVIGTALYTFNADLGEVTFGTDQQALPYYIQGYTYDLNAAAATIWRTKASHYASAYDFSTDNHNMRRSQLLTQAQSMAAMYASMGLSNVLFTERGDM
jgi:hypothetical protein